MTAKTNACFRRGVVLAALVCLTANPGSLAQTSQPTQPPPQAAHETNAAPKEHQQPEPSAHARSKAFATLSIS